MGELISFRTSRPEIVDPLAAKYSRLRDRPVTSLLDRRDFCISLFRRITEARYAIVQEKENSREHLFILLASTGSLLPHEWLLSLSVSVKTRTLAISPVPLYAVLRQTDGEIMIVSQALPTHFIPRRNDESQDPTVQPRLFLPIGTEIMLARHEHDSRKRLILAKNCASATPYAP